MANEVEIRVIAKDDASAGLSKVRESADEAVGGFDRVGEAADASEGKAQGFSDTLTGTSDIMAGAG